MTRDVTPDTLVSIVAPVFNEAENIEDFISEVRQRTREIDLPGYFEIVLVNDGSTDDSAEKLDAIAKRFPLDTTVIHLSRNFGHQVAIMVGLDHANGDAVILMDSDMQDDPVAFKSFVEKWRDGFDVVYAVRVSRQESLVKRTIFATFYRILHALADISIPMDAGIYSLMDKRVVSALRQMKERNRYLPGLRAWVGYRQAGVAVPRRERYDRQPRVGVRGLWRLAMNALFSFSYVPLAFFRVLGTLAIALSFIIICWALYHTLVTKLAIPSWASELITTSFFAGVNLLGISMIGEYVARIYDEVKNRPRYLIDRVTGKNGKEHLPATNTSQRYTSSILDDNY